MATVLVGCSQEAEEVIIEPTLLERCIASNSKDIEVNYADKHIILLEKLNEFGVSHDDFIQSGLGYLGANLLIPEADITEFNLTELELNVMDSHWSAIFDSYSKEDDEFKYSSEGDIEFIRTLEAEVIKTELDRAETVCNMQGIY
jgi:hypothetical protein